MAENSFLPLERVELFSSRNRKRSLLLLQGDSAGWSVECRDLCQDAHGSSPAVLAAGSDGSAPSWSILCQPLASFFLDALR